MDGAVAAVRGSDGPFDVILPGGGPWEIRIGVSSFFNPDFPLHQEHYDFPQMGGLLGSVEFHVLSRSTRISHVAVREDAVVVELEPPQPARFAVARDRCPESATGPAFTGRAVVSLTFPLPRWSPAHPRLVTVVVGAFTADGAQLDCVRVRAGARKVRVAGGTILLDSEPVVVRGVHHGAAPVRYG